MASRAEGLKDKGNQAFIERKYEEAITFYLKAIEAAMEDGEKSLFHIIWCNLAHVNNKTGNHKDSEKFARLAIQSKPEWYKGYYRAAQAARHLGRPQEALALLKKGIDNCVENDQLREEHGAILEELRAVKPARRAAPPPPPPLVVASNSRPEPPPAPPECAKTDVFSSVLAQSKPATQLSESQAAAARAGHPDALRQELCVTVRRGSVALRRAGGAREAFEEYRRALQLLARHEEQLKPTSGELVSLRYCFALACHETATLETLQAAETELLTLLEKAAKPVPAASYLLGKIYLRLNRFEPARQALSRCSQMLERGALGETFVYPGTSDTVPDSERARRGELRTEVETLLRQSRCAPAPDARCRLPACLGQISTPDPEDLFRSVQVTRRDIYYSDVDFTGFMTVQCLDKCQLEYHLNCWRKLKEEFGPETQRTKDKDLLDTPCLTPDCGSSVCRICIVGADTLEKHELTSELYQQRQQRPQQRQARQQKKATAQPQKKQANKPRKQREAEGGRDKARNEEEPGPQKSASDPSVSGAAGSAPASGSATCAAAVAPPIPTPTAPQLGSVPDLREMTMLRRDSDPPEVPAQKKKKKRKGTSSRRRGAELSIWGAPDDEPLYNGPPVNVIYTTDPAELTFRLERLGEMRTLQFSTRLLIPDSSVQSAEVPRRDDVSEEDHAVLESAYQFLYDYLKTTGPTQLTDSGLLAVTNQLSGQIQQLIAEHGSLEDFLLRLPRFHAMDSLICVDTDVAVAETMVGSSVSELLGLLAGGDSASGGQPARGETGAPEYTRGAAAGGATRSDAAVAAADAASSSAPAPERQPQPPDPNTESAPTPEAASDGELFRFDPVTGELLDSDEEAPESSSAALQPSSTDPDPSSEEPGPDTADMDPDSAEADLDSADADLDPDSVDLDPDYVDLDPDSANLDPGSANLDHDSADLDPDSADLDPDSADRESDLVESQADGEVSEEEQSLEYPDGAEEGRGDGAWKAFLKQDGDKRQAPPPLSLLPPSVVQSGPWQYLRSLQQAVPPAGDQADQLQELQRELRQLREKQSATTDELRAALITKLRLERTVQQLMKADPAQSPAAGLQTQLDTAQLRLSETSAQLEAMRQQLTEAQAQKAEAEQTAAQLQQKLGVSDKQLTDVREGRSEEVRVARMERDEARAQLDSARETLTQKQQEWRAAQNQLTTANQLLIQQGAAQQQQVAQLELHLQDGAAQLEALQHHATLQQQQMEEMNNQLEAARAWSERASPELQQLQQQAARADRLQAELTEAQRQAAGAEEARQAERRTGARYVSLLSTAGTGTLDAASRRCADGVAGLQRLAEAVGMPEQARDTTRRLQEAQNTIEKTRAAFKEMIKAACKAIKNRESVELRSLSMPAVPDIDAILSSAPAAKGQAVRAAAAAAPALVRPPRPSSAVTVSSNGSDGARASAAPSPPPPRAVSPRRPSPAAVQLSAASTTAAAAGQPVAATPFTSLVDEILAQCGAAGSREAVLRQLAVFRAACGGSLRGLVRSELVAQVAALVVAECIDNGSGTGAPVPLPRMSTQPSREECLICRELYTPEQSQQLPCGHRFHELCLRRWKQESGMYAPCPICRRPFTSDAEFPTL